MEVNLFRNPLLTRCLTTSAASIVIWAPGTFFNFETSTFRLQTIRLQRSTFLIVITPKAWISLLVLHTDLTRFDIFVSSSMISLASRLHLRTHCCCIICWVHRLQLQCCELMMCIQDGLQRSTSCGISGLSSIPFYRYHFIDVST